MKIISALTLFALSFSVCAATQNNEQTLRVQNDDYKIETGFGLRIPQTVTSYKIASADAKVIKNIIAQIEKKGFHTSTASLSGLESDERSIIMTFTSGNNGLKLTSSILSEILINSASIQNKQELRGVMPDRQYMQIDNDSLSVINIAQSKYDNGQIMLTQNMDANYSGNQISATNKFGLSENGAILNVIKIKPDSYVLVLTTIWN
ncbi:TPA: hypothetical protein ACR8QZ_003800 [Enterobacter roggenkampii]